WYFKPAPPLPVSRFAIALPEGAAFTGVGRHVLALSPDGTRMAFIASNRVYLRSMKEIEAKPVGVAENLGNLTEPVFSPDGTSIVFYSAGESALKRVSISGGPATTLCPALNPLGMSWGEGGVLFGQSIDNAIQKVSPNGGTPETLVTLKDPERAHGPQLLPGGEAVLFTYTNATGTDRWDKADVVVQSLKTGERKRLITGATDARYL